MSTFTVTIQTSNAAFDDAGGTEVARLLRGIADSVDGEPRQRMKSKGLYDVNGNRVGQWKWEAEVD